MKFLLNRDYGIAGLTDTGPARLREACELAKRRLSFDEQTRVAFLCVVSAQTEPPDDAERKASADMIT